MSFSDSLRNVLAPWQRRGANGYGRLASWYRQRPRREQRLLAIAAGVMGTAIIFLVLIEPAWSTMTRAQRQLPELRAQAATVSDLTAQVRALRRQGGHNAGDGTPSIEELAASLQREGLNEESWTLALAPAASLLNTSHSQTAQIPGNQDLTARQAITLTLNDASSSALFRWLDTTARDWRLSVVKADLTRALHATGRRLPGRLSGTVVLLSGAQS